MNFGDEPEITIDYFLNEAQKWVSAKDLNILANVDINDFSYVKKTNKVLKRYKELESRLRTDIALWRQAQQREQD